MFLSSEISPVCFFFFGQLIRIENERLLVNKGEGTVQINVGDVLSWSRTFTEKEILDFADLSGDKGAHHINKDEQGRLMVHGLLTASIGTKIGGDLNFIAREMTNEFLRPVFSGDTIKCKLTIKEVNREEKYDKISLTLSYRNQVGKEVLKGSSYGVIKK
jgi:3-hydroxybutyryl-CoA dehydratase